MAPVEHLQQRAEALHPHGLPAHWHGLAGSTWEETERARRSLERRLGGAPVGRFKPLADFDWNGPGHCDRAAVSELLTLESLDTAANAVLAPASGLGKSTLAQNIAHQAALHCADACVTRRHRPYWSLMKPATCPTRTATPACCSS